MTLAAIAPTAIAPTAIAPAAMAPASQPKARRNNDLFASVTPFEDLLNAR